MTLRRRVLLALIALIASLASPAAAQVTKPGGGFVPPGKLGGGGGGAGTITGITTGASAGISGGCTSGTCVLTLLTTCSGGQELAWNSGTSSWGCVSPTSGTVTSVASGTGLTGGTITGAGTLSIATTAVTAGSYTNGSFTVNAEGQLTAASSGTTPVTPSSPGTSNRVAKFTSASAIGNSDISDNGTIVDLSAGLGYATVTSATGDAHFAGILDQAGAEVFSQPGTNLVASGPTVSCPPMGGGGGGCVPSGGTTSTYLRGDGSWQTPPGGISGLTNNTIPVATSGTTLGNSLLTTTTSGGAPELLISEQANILSNGGGFRGLGIQQQSSGITSSAEAIAASNNTTHDTTSGAITSYGVESQITASRSAGSNSLTNIALYGTATGGQVNVALEADAGNVILNNTSGTTLVNGAATFAGNVILNASTGGTTIDGGLTLGGALSGGTGYVTSGPETMPGTTITVTDTGTQDNYAPTGIGTANIIRANNASSLTIDGIVGGTDGRSLYICAVNGQSVVLANEAAGSTAANRIWALNNANATLVSNATNSNACAQLLYDSTSSRWRMVAQNTDTFTSNMVFSGTLTSTANATALGTTTTGRLTVNGLTSANHSLIADWAFTGGTSSGQAAANINNTGTLNTTSGALTAYGVESTISATRSSGANNLTNIAGYFTASGAQVNQALVADSGDVILNNTSGTTTIAGTSVTFSGATEHLSVVGATVPVLSSCGTGPTIHGSDIAGRFTTGTTATTCTLTFGASYTNPPACILTAEGTATPPTYTNSATTIAMTVDIASTTYDYHCVRVQ